MDVELDDVELDDPVEFEGAVAEEAAVDAVEPDDAGAISVRWRS